MTTEIRSSQSEFEKIRRDIAASRARIAEYQKEHPGEPFPFAKLYGASKGKVRLMDEDIEATKIKVRDLPE